MHSVCGFGSVADSYLLSETAVFMTSNIDLGLRDSLTISVGVATHNLKALYLNSNRYLACDFTCDSSVFMSHPTYD